MILRTLVFLLALQPTVAHAELCTPDMKVGDKCHAEIHDVHPTQDGVGMEEVKSRKKEIASVLDDNKKLTKYLKANRGTVVIGPGGKYYLIDGHHHAVAADQEHLKYLYLEVKANLSNLSESDFWKEMVKNKWVRLVSRDGKPMTASMLQEHISGLGDDPYRSLAWAVEKSDGFKDLGIPFAEFDWADYYRTRIPLEELHKDFDGTVKKAIAISFASAAQDLPGAIKVKPSKVEAEIDKCSARFEKLQK